MNELVSQNRTPALRSFRKWKLINQINQIQMLDVMNLGYYQ